MSKQNHAERAHSKFSASGAERWFSCPGSVALSEGQPDKSSPWAIEGTQAHEVLETMMLAAIRTQATKVGAVGLQAPSEMIGYGRQAANFILGLYAKTPDSDLMVETRIYLDFIHPEMFGTFDGAVVDHFGTLHVFDYKYGAGHAVTPRENLQMIFYGIGLAHKFDWNFKRVRLWIIQPRIKGYDGPMYWEIGIEDLRAYVPKFREAVARVEDSPETYFEGGHCHWCKAKSICPLKAEQKIKQAKLIFGGSSDGESKKEITIKKVERKKRSRQSREESIRRKIKNTVTLEEFSEVRFLEDQDFY